MELWQLNSVGHARLLHAITVEEEKEEEEKEEEELVKNHLIGLFNYRWNVYSVTDNQLLYEPSWIPCLHTTIPASSSNINKYTNK